MPLQFFYIEDLCRLIERILDMRPAKHIYNTGNPEPISVLDWVAPVSYTHLLDYVGELNACKACPGLAQCPKNFKGYMRLLTIDQGEVVRYFEACEQQQEDEKKRQAMNRIQANVCLLYTSRCV